MSISTYYDCTSGNSWNRNTQPVNLVFTSGGEFASFYNENEQLIGDSFSGILSDFQTVSISQDSIYSGTPDKYLIVQCEWGGIIKTDSLKLLTQTGTEIVADTYGMDSLYSGQEIMIFINVNDLSGQCPVYLPPEANYNIQIIEGSQYGNLIDPITGNRVKNIAELDHYYGFAYLNYTADGLSADSVQRVVVRIGTTYPGIPNTDFTLYIKPSPIFAYTVPEVLGADDTADVIIKHRLEDGTLEDFPPEQTFELTVLDGCVNGNFMLGDSINVYFADALQPIKFVTADIIDPEFDKVLIRVGTDIDGGGGGAGRPVGGENEEEIVITEQRSGIDTLRAGFEKMIAEKKAEVEAKKNKTGGEPPIEAPIVTQCALDQSNKEFNWQGLASIGRGCKEYSCNEQIQIEPPLISLDKYKTIDYPNLLLCDPISNAFTGGYFRPLFDNVLDEIKDELLVHFEVFTCFDENDDLWKFKVNNGIGFKFRVIEDLCYSNLQGLILIKNANIDLFNKIPDEKVCQALKDFEDQRRYYRGGISDGAFIIESALLNHEEVHEWTFIHHINKTLNDKFYNATYGEIMTFKESLTLAKECNDLFSNFENSRSRAKTEYENVMQEFINKLKDRYNRHKENKFKLSGVEYSVSEILAQWNPHVQLEINVYQSNLEMFRGEGDCKYRIEKVFEESIYEKILDQIGNN